MRLGFVVGLAAEARIVARYGHLVRAGGGTPEGAARAATELIGQGAQALVSFGLAGGLDPVLRPGDLVVPGTVLADGVRFAADPALAEQFGGFTGHTMLAAAAVIRSRSAKREMFRLTGAHTVDLESGAVARVAAVHGVPFSVMRAVCDPAERSLPHAALVAIDEAGAIRIGPLLASVLTRPLQIGGLLMLARDSAAAQRALDKVLRRVARA